MATPLLGYNIFTQQSMLIEERTAVEIQSPAAFKPTFLTTPSTTAGAGGRPQSLTGPIQTQDTLLNAGLTFIDNAS